jgi:hypothetical protein
VTHFITNAGSEVLIAALAAMLGWFGRKMIRRLDLLIGLPEAVEKLAAAIREWDQFRVDVDRRLTTLEKKTGIRS